MELAKTWRSVTLETLELKQETQVLATELQSRLSRLYQNRLHASGWLPAEANKIIALC